MKNQLIEFFKCALIALCIVIPTKLYAFSIYKPIVNIDAINIHKGDWLAVDKLTNLKVEDNIIFKKSKEWWVDHYVGKIIKLENNIAFVERDKVIYNIPINQIVGRIQFKIWSNK